MICFPTDNGNADKKIYVDEETGEGDSLSSVFLIMCLHLRY